MTMSPHLQAICATVTNLVDLIEAASETAPPARNFIERHPLAFAIASLGLELVGWRLLARSRAANAAGPVTWWTPADSDGYLH